MDLMNKKARVIAYYLPQYHPTPQNDKFWGKGFTEWTNVTKAKPLFKGHYQPKLPADLGFYDLRLPIVREQQAQMAQDAGIEGFMYWHYWFGNGVMTLEDIFEDVLKSGKPDFPFCLGWANHEWSTKTWTKGKTFQKDTVIFDMQYPGEKDWIAHFNYCLPAFKDKRYIRVDGKPLFFIWQPATMPDVKEFIAYWRKLADKAGLPGIHFVALRAKIKPSIEEHLKQGFDAVNCCHQNYAEDKAAPLYLWKKIRGGLLRYSHGMIGGLRKYNYKKISKFLSIKDEDTLDYVYPTIVAGYDRTARAGKNATIYNNFTPDLFKKHVEEVINNVQSKNDEHKIIFLKSWNEWAEGNYVEPDLKYGHSFLDILRNSILKK